MARLSVHGLDEMEAKLKKLEQGLRGEAEVKMLNAGAAVLVGAWQEVTSPAASKRWNLDVDPHCPAASRWCGR